MDNETLFAVNLPPKSLGDMANWLDTPEGREWFLNPIVGWDENGNPIRKPIDCSLISVGEIDASVISVICLRCGSKGCNCK